MKLDAQEKINKIIDLSVRYWSVDKNLLLSRYKVGIIGLYKIMLTYLIYTEIETSLLSIGQMLGGIDHSSVIYRRNQMQNFHKMKDPVLHQYYQYKKHVMAWMHNDYDPQEYFDMIKEIDHAHN